MKKRFVIDTDTAIYYLKKNKNVVKKFSTIDPDDITTTIINYTELLFGAYNSAKKEDNLSHFKSFLDEMEIIGFDKSAAEVFARLKAQLKQAGLMIDDMDLMIASICVANHFTRVTNNTKHFQRINELSLENWSLEENTE
jgi:tRNA(fMet)-specific endonuclease VapC